METIHIMEESKFKKIQKQIATTVNHIEKEAIMDGADISDDIFQSAINGLKERMLNKHGLSLDDYENLKTSFKEKKESEEKPEEIELKIT